MRATTKKTSRKLSWKKKLLYSALVVLVGCFVAELGLRAVFAFRVGPRILLYGTSYHRNTAANHTVMRHEHARSGYTKYFANETKVDRSPGTGEVFQVTINSHGFRGPEFSEEKPTGVIRVVSLGASSTFGYYCKDNETYPHYLEQLLNQAAASRTFEVINLGIPHLRSEQILALFRAEALPLNPDIVTFYEGYNDSFSLRQDTPTTKLREDLVRISWLRDMYRGARDRLLVLTLIDSFFEDNTVTYDAEFLEKHRQGKSERFLENISELRRECEQRAIRFIVATQQARSMTVKNIGGVTYAEEVQMIEDKIEHGARINHNELAFLTHSLLVNDIEAWALSQGISVLDVIELLDHDRDVLLSSVHLSPRGNRMIAEALAVEIGTLLSKQ